MSKICINKISPEDLYIVKLCRVTPSKGYINVDELNDMCKEYGYIIELGRLASISTIKHQDIIIKRKPIITEPKQVHEFLTSVKLDYVKVVHSEDSDYRYGVSTDEKEFDLFALKEVFSTHPTIEEIEKYIDEHSDTDSYKAHLENLRFGCRCTHHTIKEMLKAR